MIFTASPYLAAHILRIAFPDPAQFREVVIISVTAYLVTYYTFDLYNVYHRFTDGFYQVQYIFAVIIGTSLAVMVAYFMVSSKFPRSILLLSAVFITLTSYIWHTLYYWIFIESQKGRNVIIIGAGRSGKEMYDTLNRYNHGAFQVVGFLDDDSTKANKIIGACTILGTSQTLVQMAKKNAIDVAVIAITKVKQPDLMRALLEVKAAGVDIYDMPAFYEELTGKLPVDHLRDGWIAYTRFQGMQRRAYNIRIKRLTDIVLSIVGLIVSLPLCTATALAIKVDSKGPILFKQTRIGLNRRPFDLIKFRTMVVGMEHDRQFAGQMDDPRITRVGRIIRKLRIDELPQMWSVLKGDMSFIGPRALIEEEVDEFEQKIPYFSLRHSIPPGITGWAQVNYRHGATLKDGLEKLKYDLFYLKNLSPLLDLHILFKTAWVVLFGKGAR